VLLLSSRLVCVFGVFFLFHLVGTLVGFRGVLLDACGGCLVFVGLRLFDPFFYLGCGGGYVCSQHRW
jgi:hypothetical protein